MVKILVLDSWRFPPYLQRRTNWFMKQNHLFEFSGFVYVSPYFVFQPSYDDKTNRQINWYRFSDKIDFHTRIGNTLHVFCQPTQLCSIHFRAWRCFFLLYVYMFHHYYWMYEEKEFASTWHRLCVLPLWGWCLWAIGHHTLNDLKCMSHVASTTRYAEQDVKHLIIQVRVS